MHTIDDAMLEGRCCSTVDDMPCTPTLDGPCQDAICSVGMAGTGLFKLGCLTVQNSEVMYHHVMEFLKCEMHITSMPRNIALENLKDNISRF